MKFDEFKIPTNLIDKNIHNDWNQSTLGACMLNNKYKCTYVSNVMPEIKKKKNDYENKRVYW